MPATIDDLLPIIERLKKATARNSPVRDVSGTVTMTDDATMYVVCSESPRRGTHWLVKSCGVIGTAALSPVNNGGGSPLCGLFRVPVSVKPETLAQGALATGFYPGADLLNRGVPLPSLSTCPNSGSDGSDTNSPAFFFSTVLASNEEIAIPYGQTLAGIYTCNPGQAQPGPGTGSRATITASIVEVEEGENAI